MKTIKLEATGAGHEAPITGVAMRSDGLIATSSYDGTVQVWAQSDGLLSSLRTFRHRRLVNSVAWNPVSPDLLASASADKTVAIWDVSREGDPLVSLMSRHTDDVNSISWMPDGKRIVCVSEDGHVSVWDATTSEFLGSLAAHRAHCMAVSVSCAGDIASVGEDGLVSVTLGGDLDGERLSRTYESSIEGCAWSSDGQLLALALDSGALEIIRREDLSTHARYSLASSAVRSVAWANGDIEIVAGTYDGAVYIVNRDSSEVRALLNDRAWPRSVACSDERLVVGSFTSTPQLYCTLRDESPVETGVARRGPNAMAMSGDRVVIGTDSGEVLHLHVDGLSLDRTTKVLDSPVLALATRGDVVFGSTYSGLVFRIDGEGIAVSGKLGAPLPSLAVLDEVVVAGTYGGDLIGLDASSLEVVSSDHVHEGSIKSLARIDGTQVAAASTDHTVSVGTAKERRVLWSHGNLVNAVAQLDGRVVASASRDRTVRVGVVPEGVDEAVSRQRVLLGPDESIKAVAIVGTPERPVVVAGSYDFGLYAWSVDLDGDSLEPLISGERFATHDQAISSIIASGPDHFVVAGWDRRVSRYGVGDGQIHLLDTTELTCER